MSSHNMIAFAECNPYLGVYVEICKLVYHHFILMFSALVDCFNGGIRRWPWWNSQDAYWRWCIVETTKEGEQTTTMNVQIAFLDTSNLLTVSLLELTCVISIMAWMKLLHTCFLHAHILYSFSCQTLRLVHSNIEARPCIVLCQVYETQK